LLLHFFRKMKQHNVNFNVNWVVIVVEIATSMKVVLIDDGPAIGTLWTENQFQRFADCRLARIIVAHKKCVALKINFAVFYTSEILDRHMPDNKRLTFFF